MEKPIVSVVKVNDVYESLKHTLELCNGLQGMHTGDTILIKPNNANWDFDLPFPPYGAITTSAVMAALPDWPGEKII